MFRLLLVVIQRDAPRPRRRMAQPFVQCVTTASEIWCKQTLQARHRGAAATRLVLQLVLADASHAEVLASGGSDRSRSRSRRRHRHAVVSSMPISCGCSSANRSRLTLWSGQAG
jgi:hypothetical protein